MARSTADSALAVFANERLLLALFVAVAIHTLLLNMHFSLPESRPIHKDIEMTLLPVNVFNPPRRERIPEQEHRVDHAPKAIKPEPVKQKAPSVAPQAAKTYVPQHPAPVKPQPAPKDIAPKVLAKPRFTLPKVEQAIEAVAKPAPQLSREDLRLQIAQLGANIVKAEPSEALAQIKYSNAVRSNSYVSEQYVADFTYKIEKVGALNFPKMAQKKNFRLTMDIGIKEDGSLYSIRIRKSSGNPAVDEAAKKIVHMSAPFPPLPKALLKELNVLVITRIWSFSDESGMTVK